MVVGPRLTWVCWMSLAHCSWLSSGSTDGPMFVVLRLFEKLGLGGGHVSRAPVVHHRGEGPRVGRTGPTQESTIQSWKLIFPSVVSASSLGLSSPSCVPLLLLNGGWLSRIAEPTKSSPHRYKGGRTAPRSRLVRAQWPQKTGMWRR